MALEFYVRSDLVEAGRDEDGTQITSEVFYVVAEDAKGNRWAHNMGFPSLEVKYMEGQAYTVDRGGEKLANRLHARIVAAGAIDLARWSPISAAYGSQSHNEADQYDDDDREIQRRRFG